MGHSSFAIGGDATRVIRAWVPKGWFQKLSTMVLRRKWIVPFRMAGQGRSGERESDAQFSGWGDQAVRGRCDLGSARIPIGRASGQKAACR